MADDEMRDKEAADDLDPAFDAIDATMKNVPPKEVTVTPEALAQIVNEAVAKAITAYQQSQGATPDSAGTSPGGAAASDQAPEATPRQPAAVPLSPWRAKIEQLKGDMGLDEIEFDEPRPEPVEIKVQRELSSQMGVNDFEFEDAPGAAAEPDAPTRTEADAIAGWALTTQDPAPLAMPDVVEETRTPAAAEEKTADADPGFDWVAEDLKGLEAEEIPTALDLEPVRIQTPEPPRYPAQEPVAPAIEVRPVAYDFDKPKGLSPPVIKPEVRETRSSLARWFRSALGDKSPERELAAAVPLPEPAAPVMPAAAPPPEPAVAAPPSLSAWIEEQPRPSRGPAAALKPMTPEEAAAEVHFTFDPILPVPPRLPRDPKEPPKKISKSGTFL